MFPTTQLVLYVLLEEDDGAFLFRVFEKFRGRGSRGWGWWMVVWWFQRFLGSVSVERRSVSNAFRSFQLKGKGPLLGDARKPGPRFRFIRVGTPHTGDVVRVGIQPRRCVPCAPPAKHPSARRRRRRQGPSQTSRRSVLRSRGAPRPCIEAGAVRRQAGRTGFEAVVASPYTLWN